MGPIFYIFFSLRTGIYSYVYFSGQITLLFLVIYHLNIAVEVLRLTVSTMSFGHCSLLFWSDVDTTVGATSGAADNGDVWPAAFLIASRGSSLSRPWPAAAVSRRHHRRRPHRWRRAADGRRHGQACQSWRVYSPGKYINICIWRIDWSH